MNRPWKIWLVFGLCAVVLVSAMGWVSVTTLRLDEAQQHAGQTADLEERARLALWRMDSLLSPLLADEAARPVNVYAPFYTADVINRKPTAAADPASQRLPSPLLVNSSSNIFLHFQLSPGGQLTSPQVPTGHDRSLAEEGGFTTRDQIRLGEERMGQLKRLLETRVAGESKLSSSFRSIRSWTKSGSTNRDLLFQQIAALEETPVPAALAANANSSYNIANAPPQMFGNDARQNEMVQSSRNSAEFQQRYNASQQAQQQRLNDNNLLMDSSPGSAASAPGALKPLWIGESIFLARRVASGKGFLIQGCWLNWPVLKKSLLESVRDLFPDGDLQPQLEPGGEHEARTLAALPVKLAIRPVKFDPIPLWTPVRLSLAIAWICVLLAALAVVLLLHGAVSLSERRGAFVSAVTHELRTPLTTFKMYSEMLAEGMVPDPAQQKQYLTTLCSEANRLSHLVENVLAYARLERGSARRRVEKVTLGELIDRTKPRLVQRAEQVGMTVVVDADERALSTAVHLDVSAVEQILFNLVDNACKYAAPTATEKLIHLEALPDGKFAMLRVRDHGQGISEEGARRLFQPFSKSAHEAALTAPGVGLGLALCRRLSRSMGGDLRLDRTVRTGACFELRLPLNLAG